MNTTARVFALVNGQYVATTRRALGPQVIDFMVALDYDAETGTYAVSDHTASEAYADADDALRAYADFLETYEDADPEAFAAEIARTRAELS